MTKWQESYEYVRRGASLQEMHEMPMRNLVLAHKLMEEDGSLAEDVTSADDLRRFPNVCWALVYQLLGVDDSPSQNELIQSALVAQFISAVEVRIGEATIEDFQAFLSRSDLRSLDYEDGFPGDCHEILGFDPQGSPTIKEIASNHGRTLSSRLRDYDISDEVDIELEIELAWLSAVRGEHVDALESLRRAEVALVAEEPSTGFHDWPEMIKDVRRIIYDDLSKPEMEKPKAQSKDRDLESAILNMGVMLDESIKAHNALILNALHGNSRRLDAISDRIPSIAENQELKKQFERSIQRLTRHNADDLRATRDRLGVELAYWNRLGEESRKELATAELLYQRFAGLDNEIFAPGCIAIGFYRACEREQERSKAKIIFDRFKN